MFILIVRSTLINIFSMLKIFLVKQVIYFNFLLKNTLSTLNNYSLKIFNINVSSFKLSSFVATYTMYLFILILFFSTFNFSKISSILLLPLNVHAIIVNLVYTYFNLIENCLVLNTTFKVNFQSIYLLNNLNESKLFLSLFNLYSLKAVDFYQFIVLSYFTEVLSFVNELYNNYLNYPIFILFAVLFFLTSFFSLLSLSYLGFYGVFVLNFVSLFSLWLSIVPYFTSIMKMNNFYYISLGK